MKRKRKPIDGEAGTDPVRSSTQSFQVPHHPTRFRPLPDGEPPLTLPQFLDRLKKDGSFVEKMRAHYDSMLAVPRTPQTAAMRKMAADALRTLKHHQGMWLGRQCLLKALALMDADGRRHNPGSYEAISALADEASDHLLDVLEPDRTAMMAKVTTIRETIKALRRTA